MPDKSPNKKNLVWFCSISVLCPLLLWVEGAPYTLLHLLLGLSAAADLAVSAFILFAMNRLNIAFFGGDETSVPNNRGPRLLRGILVILAIAEFAICWNWLLFPKFWLQYYQVSYTLDPFWTRATGVLLLNIAYIQLFSSQKSPSDSLNQEGMNAINS